MSFVSSHTFLRCADKFSNLQVIILGHRLLKNVNLSDCMQNECKYKSKGNVVHLASVKYPNSFVIFELPLVAFVPCSADTRDGGVMCMRDQDEQIKDWSQNKHSSVSQCSYSTSRQCVSRWSGYLICVRIAGRNADRSFP